MSVICKISVGAKYKDVLRAFVKGSPEKIEELCLPETLPSDYKRVYEGCTKQGFRVIAVATKRLKDFSDNQARQLKRENIEKNLSFLGLIILEN